MPRRPGFWTTIVAVVAVTVLWAGTPATALAQLPGLTQQENQTAQQSAEPLKTLIDILEDPAKREQLLKQLKSVTDKSGAKKGAKQPDIFTRFIDTLAERLQSLSEQAVATAATLLDLNAIGDWWTRQLRDEAAQTTLRTLGIGLAASLAAGFAGRAVVAAVLARSRRRRRAEPGSGRLDLAVMALAGLVFGWVRVVAFVGCAYLTVGLLAPGTKALGVITVVVAAIAVYEALVVLAATVLRPDEPGRRLLAIGDESAAYLMIWLKRFLVVGLLGFVLANAGMRLNLPEPGLQLIEQIFGLLVATLAVIFILQNRQVLRQALRPSRAPAGLGYVGRRLADIWHVLAILYVVAVYVVWFAGIEGGTTYILRATALSLLIIALAKGVIALADKGLGRLLAVPQADRDRAPQLLARVNRYLPALHVTISVVVGVVAALGILQSWGLNVFSALATPAGRDAIGTLITTAVVLAVTLGIWEFVNAYIERYFSETDSEGNLLERSQRARTLLPLARNLLMILLAIIAGMIVLSEVGVNIAPLLAGAGVIGIAIGFGAQKLVQDIITGAFILFEDTVRVGDIATAGGHTGMIEGISIRTIRMRDLDGAVHTVPFSDVTTIVNMTKDFSYRLFEVGVAYREDTDQVTEVLKEIAQEMRAEPQWGADILEPLEVLGVDRFADSAVVIRVRLKTRPALQWQVGREFNRRMKKRFDELGIEIPFPHQTLYFGEDKSGTAPAGRIRLLDRDAEPPRTPSGSTGDGTSGGAAPTSGAGPDSSGT